MNVSIVGAGIMGLAAAWALVRDGHRITIYEQADVPNPLGSSVDQHRLIRHPYGERGYTRMINDAYAAWDLLWSDLGARHYAPTGTLVLDRGDPWTANSERGLTAENIPFRHLDPAEIARDYSLLDCADVGRALWLETGGVLFAARIVADLARHLRQRGVVIQTSARVQEVDTDKERLMLAAGRRTVEADLVIVAAGPWVTRLLPSLQTRVTPSRQVVVYLTPPADLADAWARSPMILDIDPAVGFYLVPPRDGSGLKIGDHRFSLAGNPDRDRAAGDADARAIVTLCATRLREFGRYAVAEAKTCFYDVAPHERFIVEPLGAHGWVLSGFSGHGFKFATVLGLELARAVRGDRTIRDLSTWAAGQLPDVVQRGT